MSNLKPCITICIIVLFAIRTKANEGYKSNRKQETLDLLDGNKNSFYDPRSEMSRRLTSGEMAFEAKNSTILEYSKRSMDTDFKSTQSKNHRNRLKPSGIKNKSIMDEFYPLSWPHGINRTTPISRETFAQVQNSADNGSVEAAYFIGLFYLYGLSTINPDASRAAEWFGKASIAGNHDAQCALGLMYYKGVGSVGRDKKSALRWFYRASQSGHPRGHWLLGQALNEGMSYEDIGVMHQSQQDKVNNKSGRNFNEIARLFSLAAFTDIPDAIHQLGVLYEYDLIPQNYFDEVFVGAKKITEKESIHHYDNFKMAILLYEWAAKLGYAESIYNLGLMHTYGRGVTINLLKATDLFRTAAITHSHVGSMRYLGLFVLNDLIHDEGKDYSQAIYWFEKCSSSQEKRFSKLCKIELNDTRNILRDADLYRRKVFDNLTHNLVSKNLS